MPFGARRPVNRKTLFFLFFVFCFPCEQGLRATIARDGAGLGAFFLAFSKAKEALMKRHYGGEKKEHPPPPLPVLLLSATTAGLTFWAGACVRAAVVYIVNI